MNSLLKILNTYLPKKYKIFFFFALTLLLITSIAEIISLSSIIPFLDALQNNSGNNQSNIDKFSFLKFVWDFNKESSIFNTVIFLSLAATTAALLRLLSHWVNALMAAKFGSYISRLLFKYSMEKDYEYFASDNSNKLIVGLTQHINGTVRALNFLLQFFTGTIISFSIISFLIILSPKVTLISLLIFASSYLILSLTFKSRLIENSRFVASASQKQMKLVRESIGGIRDIILEEKIDNRILEFSKKDYSIRFKQAINQFISVFPRYAMEAVGIVTLAFVSLILKTDNSEINISTLGAIAFGAQRLLPSLQSLYAAWAMLKNFNADILFVLKSLKNKPNQVKFQKDYPLPFKDFETLSFRNVSFGYSEQNLSVIKSCNITFKKGETIGIIGKTGSGKSTFVDLLLGLLKPTKGEILVNDSYSINDNFNINKLFWRRYLSFVPQEIYLRNETILENISGIGMGNNENNNSPIIKKAIRTSLINEFIPKLADGLFSIVGERGLKLSGGQKQRVGIARALARNKPVLILDESTSALDKQTETIILENIKRNYKNLTIFMITHREDTLKHCNRILEIKSGKVKEVKPNFIKVSES